MLIYSHRINLKDRFTYKLLQIFTEHLVVDLSDPYYGIIIIIARVIVS